MNPLRRMMLPIVYRRGGSRQLYYYKYMRINQYKSMKDNMQLWKKLLYETISYSFARIPYYRDIGINTDSFSRESIFDDITQIPFLTKKELKNEVERMVNNEPPQKRVYFNSTGGSTGEPAKFVQDGYYHDWVMASKLLYNEWAGKSMGEPQVNLWGSLHDLLNQREGIRNRISNWIDNTVILNAFKMDLDDMKRYIEVINRFKPRFILAYVHSIYELAQFAENEHMQIYSPNSIMTSAGVLHQAQREKIERVFQCPVFNRYGSREVGDVACECEEHRGLHINIFSSYIEIVNDDGQPCRPGERGEVVITTLRNRTMPLVRYKIGDLAVASDEICPCGRCLPVIKEIVGRTNSIIRTNKGVFDTVAICALMSQDNQGRQYESFFKYQIVQKTRTDFIINIIIHDEKLWILEKERIIGDLKKSLGEDIRLIFQEVDKIEPLASGKYAYIISEVGDEQ
jgi:phenylacetate-CoA ligase